ncbi:MAG: hypothetical protein US52_C0006G0007 [candidate division WS6 bacterium GW2011_GWA2_37_6]|uniref:Uncharacterized protein n=1 Tax=candidate division WS6 bacterium GW2011_GWA2_37_6 TaxID=1619087 RepID=A0A0G0H211_9BACT|nr:MAG: hypothetical protein US52_C0006G0007 [candidate division WS6 bacterium GW2011_GWA2_37_6]
MEKFTVNNKWVHFIGIGGVTMAPLAVEFVKKGLRLSYKILRLKSTKASYSTI